MPEDYCKAISSLKDIRDCLSHSNGLIMPHHGQKTPNPRERKFSWFTYNIYALGKKTGNRYEMTSDNKIQEEATLMIELVPHHRIFKAGQYLIFTPGEAFDIANSLKFALNKYIEDALNLKRFHL